MISPNFKNFHQLFKKINIIVSCDVYFRKLHYIFHDFKFLSTMLLHFLNYDPENLCRGKRLKIIFLNWLHKKEITSIVIDNNRLEIK